MQLAKELAMTMRVGYCSFEEQGKMSMQTHMAIHHMAECGSRFRVFPDETIMDLQNRLDKRRSSEIVFIDSLQHAQMGRGQYNAFKKRYRDKLIVFVSHAEGKNPEGSLAKFIKYDATVKIWVEGFKAFAGGRVQGIKPYVIYEKEAEKYWGGEK
ncbi:DNA repair protein RadA [Elysia marginata]|uniref:DNA repair protein RadA n=1 Tax=Elysia marginata TaxID=1093978 RepID=A0AAV4GH45_9GAST|nr:DNA repair protein RadA [Elysia marginata]